jgi:hypothetical protein
MTKDTTRIQNDQYARRFARKRESVRLATGESTQENRMRGSITT